MRKISHRAPRHEPEVVAAAFRRLNPPSHNVYAPSFINIEGGPVLVSANRLAAEVRILVSAANAVDMDVLKHFKIVTYNHLTNQFASFSADPDESLDYDQLQLLMFEAFEASIREEIRKSAHRKRSRRSRPRRYQASA